jgi:hypothetical protein
MRNYGDVAEKARDIFVGIDVHRQRWHVTVQTARVVLLRTSIGGSWPELSQLLSRWSPQRMVAVYEAGFSGFWLYDELAAWAASGQAVRVWLPSLQQRQDREVTRGRRIVRQLRQVQCQIKALWHCYGLVIPCRAGRWSAAFEANLWRLRFASEAMQRSFERQLDHYQFLRRQLAQQTKLVRQLAAYVGLTPSQHSSGEHVRMGHISRCGKAARRGMLVESSWIAIRSDQQLAAVYERLKVRVGGKRAIVAVARRLLLRVRRIWPDGRPCRLSA